MPTRHPASTTQRRQHMTAQWQPQQAMRRSDGRGDDDTTRTEGGPTGAADEMLLLRALDLVGVLLGSLTVWGLVVTAIMVAFWRP